MEKNTVELKLLDDLRKIPEDLWRQRIEERQRTGNNDLKRQFHALQMHQIELEMQNQELRRSQAQLEASKQKEVEKRTAELVKTNEKLRRELKHRKRVEKALLESEQRFRLLADFTHDWEYWIAPDGNYIYVSPSCERITGYHPDEFVRVTGLFEKIIHPDDRALLDGHFSKDLKCKDVKSFDFRIRSRNGKERWIAHICQPVYDDNGQFAGRRASNRDITERKLAEEALHQAHRELERRVQKRSLQLKISDEELNAKQKELLNRKFELEQLNKELLETNKAISVLAKYIDKNRENTESNIARTINSSIMPIIEDLRRSKTSDNLQSHLDVLVTTMRSLSNGLSGGHNVMDSLTPTEVRVATLIKNNLSSQAIATKLHVTLHTVNTHRRNIRKKLNVRNSTVNLVSYLRSII